jgi:hypothetical protein
VSATVACIAPHRDDRPAHGAEVGYLCRPAFSRLERQIAELPALHHWLHANLPTGGGSALDPNPVSGSGDEPLPIRDTVADHLTRIVQVLSSWARMVAEERDLCGPWRPLHPDGLPERDRLRRAVEQTATLEQLATFLLAHLPWAAGQPWVDDFAGEVDELTVDAHDLVPSRPRTYRLPLPCMSCGEMLSRRDGSDIECRTCGRLWRVEQYPQLMEHAAEMVRDRSGWITPEKAAAQHGVNPKTVRTWAKRGLIAVVCAVLPGEHDGRWRVHPDEVAARASESERRSA